MMGHRRELLRRLSRTMLTRNPVTMADLLNPRRFAHRLLSVVLAGLMVLGPRGMLLADDAGKGHGESAAAVDAMARVLPAAAAVLVLRPAQILASPLADAFPHEILQAVSLQETGLDPLDIQTLVIAASPPEQGQPSYAARATFTKAATLKPGKATEHTQPGTLGGKKYWQSQDTMAPSFYMASENTLVAAPDATLRSAFERHGDAADRDGSAPSRFMAACHKAVHDDDLYLACDLAAVRPYIQMGLAFAKDIPAELAPLKEIPGLVKAIEFRLNVTQERPTEIVVTADNEKAAEKVISLVESAKQLAAAKATAAAEQLLASSDPIEQATGRYQLRMATQLPKRVQFERSGDAIIVFRLDASNQQGQTVLVSTAVVGILVALLLPAIQSAREAARRSVSLNNVRRIELGLVQYEAENGRLPAYASIDAKGNPLLSWRVHVLPFLDEQALYEAFHLDEPWDSPHNRTLIPRMPAFYKNPASKLPADQGKSGYLGVLGKGCGFTGQKEGLTVAAIADGLSNTVNLVQVSDDAAEVWSRPADWKMDPEDLKHGLGGLHVGGWVVGFMDGSCQFITNDIDDVVWKALLTTSGNESIGPYD